MSASSRAYYQAHKEEIKARAKAYKQARRSHYTQLQKDWAKNNPAARAIEKRSKAKNRRAVLQRKKDWYRKNAEEIKAGRKARYHGDVGHRAATLSYLKQPHVAKRRLARMKLPANRAKFNAHRNKRLGADPGFKLRSVVGSRISNLVSQRRGTKSAHTMELIGCDIPSLRAHLESLFTPGMSWENYGEWHIDHKRPCASFDLRIPEQQRECFHYTNLQPLWGPDNLAKGDNWAPEK